jgi:hypothetical protein
MLLPGTNSDGILVLAVGFGAAFAIEAFSPIKNDGPLTIILGVGVAALGFALRR